MPNLAGKRVYTDEELVVLCAIFSLSNFSVGDDERIECKRIAHAFDRSPGTIDRQWRNVKDYLAGLESKKVGARVKYWADRVLEDPTAVINLANFHCEANEWDLADLLTMAQRSKHG